ncbi:uncharacterized protein C7orf31 [Stegastes partitus]|uniref:Uncharacterized protein C7orf31 n=1 Tax=Stegastes partitus TaxID=144197 RepID=A0A9Y4K723_9TELE|nr:PREDICTED: uncharacterized protein C7orf31 homolog [Stegastes partitus]
MATTVQVSSCLMEPESLLTHSIPPDFGNHPWGYGGATPVHITGQQCYNNTSRKKSNVRLNDQLIPKPTDINLAEKMIQIATPKEHPYSSHISRFAMFPSFRSPDDPETGVRAASRPFLNLIIPNGAPDVSLLSKTKGAPYRHEIIETPVKTKKKAVTWTGEHGFYDKTKPLKGENQVFYPTPPKTVLPNPKLRDWDFSLSERTSNMLKNLEKSLWVTSYQMHYTGSGPANPLRMDDFKDKMITGINSHTAPLRERSHPVFVPSKSKQGCRRRQGRSTCSPSPAELLNASLNQRSASATVNQHGPREITATHNEAPDPNQMGQSQSEYSAGSAEAQHTTVSQAILHERQTHSKSSVYEGTERENCKVRFDESFMRGSVSQSSQEANAARISNTERPQDLYSRPHSQGEIEADIKQSLMELCGKDAPSSKKEDQRSCVKSQLLSGASSGQEGLTEPLHGISNPSILPRPPVLPSIRPVDRSGNVGREEAAPSLLDLQNSFSKTEAHRNFNSSITRAAVDLRDNVHRGRKHDFYGINCNYIH